MNYVEPRAKSKCLEFRMPMFGIDVQVYARVHEGDKYTTIVCCEEGRYCLYLMSGIPTVPDAKEIQLSFFEQRFDFVLNMLK